MTNETCARCGATPQTPAYCMSERNGQTICQACAGLPDDRLPSEVREDERELLLALLRAARECEQWIYDSEETMPTPADLIGAIAACEEIDDGR